MAKYQDDLMLDASFDWVRARVTKLTVCTTIQPTTYAQANSSYMLATVACTSTDMTLADGDTNGRKVTVSSFTGISVATTGTAGHVCLIGSSGSTLLLITTCTTQALTTGNTVSVPTWDDEIADAT
jgi:hypothetical protein